MNSASKALRHISCPSSPQRLASFDQISVSSIVSQTWVQAWRAQRVLQVSTIIFVSSHSSVGSSTSA